MLDDHLVNAVARNQHGLVTVSDLTKLGLSTGQISRRHATGRLERVHQGVYLVGGAPLTSRARILAACLATSGVASHRCAAVLWGLDGFNPGPPEVTVSRRRRVRIDPAVRVHQSLAFHLVNETTIDGIPVAGLVRTAVDLARFTGPTRLGHVVDQIRRRGVSWAEIWETLMLHARRGRPGIRRLRRVCTDRYGGGDPESLLERLFLKLLADEGLARPEVQFEIRDHHGFIARVDVAYPDRRVAMELDSVRWHLDARAFEADRRKRNRLKLAGWQVLEFTWSMVTGEPNLVVAQVREALRAAQRQQG